MKTYRILENGEQYWIGEARDVDHALEKCYDDGGPGSLVKVGVEIWGKVKVASWCKVGGWIKCWEGTY